MSYNTINCGHSFYLIATKSTSSLTKLTLAAIFLLLFVALSNAHLKRNSFTESHQDLPECLDEKASCGYVQLNMMGVNVQPLCSCKSGAVCPLVWDPFDGRTILHGNDQYKYCDGAPRLKQCSYNDIAYTTYTEMSMITMKTTVNSNHVHCICPATHIFIRNTTKFHQFDNGISAIITTHFCKLPPRCEANTVCMAITESAHSSFVTRKCGCPLGSFCPNDVRLAVEEVEMNKGSYYMMHCI